MIELEVVTPERHLLKVDCDSVALPGSMGEFEVLEGHTPLLTSLKSGILRYHSNNEMVRLMIAEGFAEVGANHVTVLCEGAALASEINVETEKALIEKLKDDQSKLSQEDEQGYKRIEAELERSTAKIKLF